MGLLVVLSAAFFKARKPQVGLAAIWVYAASFILYQSNSCEALTPGGRLTTSDDSPYDSMDYPQTVFWCTPRETLFLMQILLALIKRLSVSSLGLYPCQYLSENRGMCRQINKKLMNLRKIMLDLSPDTPSCLCSGQPEKTHERI